MKGSFEHIAFQNYQFKLSKQCNHVILCNKIIKLYLSAMLDSK